MLASIAFSLYLLAVPLLTRANLLADCGVGVTLEQNNVEYNGRNITISTRLCPGLPATQFDKTALRLGESGRPITKCKRTLSACAFNCNSTAVPPLLQDCNDLTIGLTRLDTRGFVTPPRSISTFVLGTCRYAFTNFDTVQYRVCDTQFSIQALATINTCLKAPTLIYAGNCTSPRVEKDNWVIDVTHS